MILLKNKDKKANVKIGNNIEIKDGNDFPFDLTLYGKSTQATRSGKNLARVDDTNISATGYTLTTSKGLITLTTTGTKNSFDLVSGTRTGTYLPNYANANDYHLTPANQGIYKLSMPNTTANITGTANQLVAIFTNQRLIQSYITPTGSLLETTSFTLQENEYVKSIYLWSNDLTTITKLQFNLQLEQGSTATEYEPYGVSPSPDFPSPIESITEISVEVSGINSQSNSLTIDLQGNELCSLPDGTKDEVNITNGEASIVKRTKEFILDENKTIVLEKVLTNTTRFLIYNVTSSMNDYPSAISTHFKYLVDYNSDTEHFYITRNGAMYLFVNKSIASTVDELKTWLSKNNVKFLHELAEPETINLGTVEMPHTYEGVSNITNSADTEMIVKYYKKFEFDKILRSGYNIDEQEYEIAKKQMANGKRKKILSSYVDCIIKIDLGLLDNKTYQEYKEQLEDGEYEYWSYKYNQYKKANFILTKPSITTEYAYDDDIGIDDMEITLEKSSDVS